MDSNIKNIKISVLIAVYDGEKYLHEAIDSVLSQTFQDFELIIVNDGSRDKTLEILRSYKDRRIIIINNEKNIGLIDSLNKGLAIARGKYVARIDHDDIALPNRFQEQYDFMEKNSDIDVVGSWTECIDTEGKHLKISRNATDPWAVRYEFLFNNIMFHSSIFFRTQKIKENGGYSHDFIHSEDYEMYSRPGKELKCANIPKVLFKLRLHSSSITASDETQPLVYKNALNVVYRNMTQYIELSRSDFDIIKNILIIKKPDPKITFKILLQALKVLEDATFSFIGKNKLNKSDRKLVIESYKGRRKMMWQHYLIAKYHELF